MCTICMLGAAGMAFSAAAAKAAPAVPLRTAAAFAVLAGQAVTNTGPSVLSGSLGVDPGASVTGFPPGLVNNGAIHAADAVSLQAQSDLTTAYVDAAGRTGAAAGPQLGGLRLTPGVYNGGALNLTGTLTLDGPGVYIFTAASSLTTATGSSVNLINGANPCDVFWQVTSSAALNGSIFAGNVLALTSITVGNGVHVDGRLLARNGNVTLINDVVDSLTCAPNAGGAGAGAGGTGGTGGATGSVTPPRFRPSGSFSGPCGDPWYAARFNNRKSNRSVKFNVVYVAFPSNRRVKISRRVKAGGTFKTPFFHVVGSTIMTIRGGPNNRILRRIRAAPAGNFRPC